MLFLLLMLSLTGLFMLYCWILGRRLKAMRGLDPLSDFTMRPAGESLREKILENDDKINGHLAALVIYIVGLSSLPMLAMKSNEKWTAATMLISAIVFVAYRLTKFQVVQGNYQLGFKGERYVGQLLDSLMRDGCYVYHDIPCETKSTKFNIDHVVISPAGVFAIETKTYRKPKELQGKARAKVEFDGAKLHFSTGRSSEGELEQATRNAKFLSKLLTDSTGDPVSAQGVLVLPAWYVERKGRGETLVVNPKEISQVVIDRRASPKLDLAAMRRICHQLGQLCSLK